MVYLLLADGFEEAEALVTADLLRRADIPLTLAGLEGKEVTGSHGITVLADDTLDNMDIDQLEMLILPGGMGGVENIQMNLFALGMIQRAAEKGAYVAAICAAPTILAHQALLDRRRAVCYPGMEDQMLSAVVCKGEAVVTDGRFITGEAAGSVFEFGLSLIRVLRGREAADKVKRAVHYHYGD